MKAQTTYTCEVCGTQWDDEAQARACEAYPDPPKPNVLPGDRVKIATRYGGPDEDTVVGLVLLPSPYSHMGVVLKGEYHRWVVQTTDQHQMSKDDSTDLIEPYMLHHADGRCVVETRGCMFCEYNGSLDFSNGSREWDAASQAWVPDLK